MAHISQFAAIRYARRPGLEMSNLIAPPFDVLDENAKAALRAKHPNNIVTIDLPHLPPKTVGPARAYGEANITLQAWLNSGILIQDIRPALYPYMQSFLHNGRTLHRRGFFCLVRLAPFGQGQVVPHEKTYAGAIEDRLALMRATGTQMSPIFGLYTDRSHEVTNLLYHDLGRPELSGTFDGVKHDLWSVANSEVENRVIDFLGTRPIYIADGHHRYTTALQYQKEMEEQNGGPLPTHHPANWCMFVLVALQDDGMLILPTHRLIGGLKWFDIEAFKAAIGTNFDVTPTPLTPEQVHSFAEDVLPKQPPHTFGLYDGKTSKLYQLRLKNPDILKPLEPNQSDAWRRLDVAILQRYLLDEILQPHFAEGGELTKGYVSDAKQITPQTAGGSYQIALIVQPTPLHALEELGRHGETMPPKSTYFYPKLATGMAINPLR